MDKSLLRKVVLAFMAHPDDAEAHCGGTLIRLADLGWQIHMASATAGDLGTMTQNRWETSACRTAEATKAAALIGAQYHCLGVQDGFVCYERSTLEMSIDLFRRISPTLVVTHPEKDYHMDHVMVHQLAREASFIYAAPKVSVHPCQDGARVPHLYYCDPVEGKDQYGREVIPTTVVDISAQMPRKTEMLACHESQRSWLRAHHQMDEYLESMRRHSEMRGKQVGVTAAEAFVQHRGHAYPADDLLSQLFAR